MAAAFSLSYTEHFLSTSTKAISVEESSPSSSQAFHASRRHHASLSIGSAPIPAFTTSSAGRFTCLTHYLWICRAIPPISAPVRVSTWVPNSCDTRGRREHSPLPGKEFWQGFDGMAPSCEDQSETSMPGIASATTALVATISERNLRGNMDGR